MVDDGDEFRRLAEEKRRNRERDLEAWRRGEVSEADLWRRNFFFATLDPNRLEIVEYRRWKPKRSR
jgi:hypothetical protein